MSDMAKQARAAMKAKAKSLTSADPHQKVDSSTWSPAEPLNADIKTGLRPISRRAFKSGGKVEGEKSKCSLGRKPRKSGGSTEAKQWMNAKINRNVKDANEEREGIKHVGGMKKGGRTKKQSGGNLTIEEIIEKDKSVPASNPGPMTRAEAGIKSGPMNKAANAAAFDKQQQEYQKSLPKNRNAGGRTKKMLGGPMMSPTGLMAPVAVGTPQGAPGGGQSNLPQNVDPNDQRFRMVSPQTFNFGSGASGHPYKKGGAVKHPDEKMDIALIKKMVKPSARKGKNNGGGTDEGYIGPGGVGQEYNSQDQYAGPGGIAQESKGIQGRLNAKSDRDYAARRVAAEMDEADTRRKALDATIGHLPQSKDDAYEREHGRYSKWKAEHGITGLKKGGRAARKEGNGVFSGPGYPGKIPGVVPGGRDAHARGGKTRGKGKTNINIIVAAGQKPGMGMTPPGGPTPPPGMDQGPGAAPIPMPAQNPQATPMPMPMPIPIPMGGAGGAGAAPTARKSGGRLTKVAHSFKDMQAGAGSGEGRLQKTDIAKARMGRKAGGKTYRSYKDMDAGAGSGMGRLEKTEIQARKG